MSSRVGVNLRASAYLHQGDRKYMEDEFQVAYQRTHDKKDIEYAFFGIFDGHGGKEAAHYAKDNLMDNIVSQRLFWSDDDEDVLSAIKEGFLQTHMAMWKVLDQWPRTASGWPSTSGTTASIAFIRRQKIYIGHVGDSGIVLGFEDDNEEWVGELLTRDHKPESHIEMCRINECGGKVVAKSGVPRVVWNRPKSGHQGPVRRSTPMDEIPFLAVARSLGDLWSYNAINDRFVVSPEPDVYVKEIDINFHRCLIFGTDGLWNALSPSTAVNIAYCTEKNNEKHYLGLPMYNGKPRLWINPSRSIVTGALSRYLRVNLRADNTSAVTVYFDPPGRPKREVLLSQFAQKKGSPKNAGNKSTTKKVNREAAVQVHVYNQTPKEGNKGLFRIKERIPDDDWRLDKTSCNSPPLAVIKGPICPESDKSKDSPVTKVATETEESSSSACSECGCTNHQGSAAQSSVNNSNYHSKNIIQDELNKKEENIPISHKSDAKTKKDDIQIPVVSSSTNAEKSTSVFQSSNNNNLSLPLSSNREMKRRTRSCASITTKSISENKVDKFEKKQCLNLEAITSKTRSNKLSRVSALNIDSANRILKSVNRGEKSDPAANAYISQKRKRTKDPIEEERTPKSIRVHTRSHSCSHNAMITRSQDRPRTQKIKFK